MKEDEKLQFNVNLSTFSGPLDTLLDLAKSQKVNLENISITKLADQFHEFITKSLDLNLELASEYLLMATWLAYLKSKLLLPETDEEEFKALEVAEKLKLQLKKLELIRLLSDQMLKRKRLGKDIFMRGVKGQIKSIYSSEYNVSLFELLKTYANIIMTKDLISQTFKDIQDYICKELSEMNFSSKGNLEILNESQMSNGLKVKDNLVNLISKIGEKITIKKT